MQQRGRLAATLGASPGQVEREEALVAGLLHVAAERRGVGADLGLLAVNGDGGQAPAALGEHLLAERALGRGEQLVDAERLEARDPERDLRARRCSPASASASTASLSSSGTSKGSRSAGLVYVPIAGGSSASAAPGAVGCAAAIASARSSASSASALPVPRTAAKPQAPPTRTRTPIPSESSKEAWSTSPLRVASRSDWVRTNRASAYSDRPAAASIKS